MYNLMSAIEKGTVFMSKTVPFGSITMLFTLVQSVGTGVGRLGSKAVATSNKSANDSGLWYIT